jgi:MFS family permease
MKLTLAHRNVLILSVCQAIVWSSASVMITSSALAAKLMADESLATLPLGLHFTASTLSTFAASMLMRHIGRRAGFTIGAAFGLACGVLSAWAIYAGSFVAFCLGGMLFGVAMAFAQYYRFAAAEAATPAFRSRAISFVIAGGVVSALVGPELAVWARDLLTPVLFAGSYLVIAGLFLLAGLLIQFLRIPLPAAVEEMSGGRPLAVIARQPAYAVAVLGGVVGYAMMMLVMTATPLAMEFCGFSFDDSAFVIQWHALGMFAPSFFTGALIARFGVLNVMTAGAALIAGCIAVDLSGVSLMQFWGGLLLVGLGWNFLYVGSTSLLTEAYRPEERAKAQGLNDSLVFGMVALTTFSSGWLHSSFGWAAVNLAGVVPVAAVILGLLWLRRRRAAGLA